MHATAGLALLWQWFTFRKSGTEAGSALTANSVCVLLSGSFVLLHAFWLPYRAAVVATSWGEARNRPAQEAAQFAGYLCSLYLVDFFALLFHLLPPAATALLHERCEAEGRATRVGLPSNSSRDHLDRSDLASSLASSISTVWSSINSLPSLRRGSPYRSRRCLPM